MRLACHEPASVAHHYHIALRPRSTELRPTAAAYLYLCLGCSELRLRPAVSPKPRFVTDCVVRTGKRTVYQRFPIAGPERASSASPRPPSSSICAAGGGPFHLITVTKLPSFRL